MNLVNVGVRRLSASELKSANRFLSKKRNEDRKLSEKRNQKNYQNAHFVYVIIVLNC